MTRSIIMIVSHRMNSLFSAQAPLLQPLPPIFLSTNKSPNLQTNFTRVYLRQKLRTNLKIKSQRIEKMLQLVVVLPFGLYFRTRGENLRKVHKIHWCHLKGEQQTPGCEPHIRCTRAQSFLLPQCTQNPLLSSFHLQNLTSKPPFPFVQTTTETAQLVSLISLSCFYEIEPLHSHLLNLKQKLFFMLL